MTNGKHMGRSHIGNKREKISKPSLTTTTKNFCKQEQNRRKIRTVQLEGTYNNQSKYIIALILSNGATQVSCERQTCVVLSTCCNQLHPKISGGKKTPDTDTVKMTQTLSSKSEGVGKSANKSLGVSDTQTLV